MSGDVDTLDLWLDGRLAGQLLRGVAGDVEFIYDAAYSHDPYATPVSMSLPKSHQNHGPDRVMPWLSNLLPDAQEVRERWARKFHEHRSDPFTLLRYMGQDAPGSVQIVPEGESPSQTGVLAHISEAKIADRIAGILVDPEHWVDDTDEDESRFSLGGYQGKFALSRVGDRWFEPNGRAASTHIVKPGMVTATGATNDSVQAVEFVTMRAARAVQVPAATVEILDFAGTQAFVTTRYDRVVQHDGEVTRVHQEDFCQALSVFPTRKYEDDGGPTLGDTEYLVRTASSPSYRDQDRSALVRLAGFNLLAAGVDAHAKNHSLLLVGRNVRLAPAYDLISAHGIWDEHRVRFKSGAAVKYGKNRRYRNITGRDLARAADVLRIDRKNFVEQLRELAKALPEAFDQAVAELPQGFAVEQVRRMPDRVRRFADDVVNRVSESDLLETPKFEGARMDMATLSTRVWMRGHRASNGTWQTGYYRHRT
ncbi:type II toxin-antitoxin system HipA family toxin [Leucobacter sp. HY1908]